jgi:O-acetyl-ADP-ribose deacetylase (regulator of RNase III)
MKISVIQGDITAQQVDAIVNAANSGLLGGGGVDGAIHRAGGPSIMRECEAIRASKGGCATGDAVITGGGSLFATYVIHTVGPVWHGGSHNEDALLRSCYAKSMELAGAHGVKTIAFPNISTGVYGFPKSRAAAIVKAFFDEFLKRPSKVEAVVFVAFDEENFSAYRALFGG